VDRIHTCCGRAGRDRPSPRGAGGGLRPRRHPAARPSRGRRLLQRRLVSVVTAVARSAGLHRAGRQRRSGGALPPPPRASPRHGAASRPWCGRAARTSASRTTPTASASASHGPTASACRRSARSRSLPHRPRAQVPGVVVTNVSTTRAIDEVARRHGGTVVRTPVGQSVHLEAMMEHRAVIGGEGKAAWPCPRAPVARRRRGPGPDRRAHGRSGATLRGLVDGLPSFAMVKHDFAEKRACSTRSSRTFRDAIEREGIGADAPTASRCRSPTLGARARVAARVDDQGDCRGRHAAVRATCGLGEGQARR